MAKLKYDSEHCSAGEMRSPHYLYIGNKHDDYNAPTWPTGRDMLDDLRAIVAKLEDIYG
jgi:hypothetical protein